VDYKILSNGVKMPIVGFGVFQVDDQKVCEQAVLDAIEVGYRSIDTAATYLNEEAVGRAVATSGIKREEFFITTKLWVQDHGYDNTKRAFDKSLKKLGLDSFINPTAITMVRGGRWKICTKRELSKPSG